MRRAGVLVVDVPPERTAQVVVAKYLELYRRVLAQPPVAT